MLVVMYIRFCDKKKKIYIYIYEGCPGSLRLRYKFVRHITATSSV